MFGLLDHVVRLRGDGRNLLGAHALQVGPELVGVLLGEVVQEQDAVGALRHGEPGGQLAATVPTGCLLAGEVPDGAGGLPKCDSSGCGTRQPSGTLQEKQRNCDSLPSGPARTVNWLGERARSGVDV